MGSDEGLGEPEVLMVPDKGDDADGHALVPSALALAYLTRGRRGR